MNDSDVAVIDEVVHRARIAQQTYEEMGSQELYLSLIHISEPTRPY